MESDIRWPSIWDAYLKMEGAQVHWSSILNSIMVIYFLDGVVLLIFLSNVRWDLTCYEELDKEDQMNEELSGWKRVVGDVFWYLDHTNILYIMVGCGVKILGMVVVNVFFLPLVSCLQHLLEFSSLECCFCTFFLELQ